MAVQEPDNKGLWVDPFSGDTGLTSGAVLLAEDIKRYVERNLLVNRDHFHSGEHVGAKLKGAGYAMTPDPEGAWMFVGEGDQARQVILKPKPDAGDKKGPFYVVEKYSLVYIKLRQELRIPYYVIGRHNLKINYIYQGLLLGTGPQVDPGYVGHLIIPLHNLTTRDVRIYVQDSFVSIDFVRTTPVQFDHGTPETRDQLYDMYGSSKALLDLRKVLERRKLEDYLEGSTPQSAMGELLQRNEAMSSQLKVAAEQMTRMKRFELAAAIGIILTWLTAVITVANFVGGSYRVIDQRQFALQADILNLRQEKDSLRVEQSRVAEDLRQQITQLCKQLAAAKGAKLVVGPCQ